MNIPALRPLQLRARAWHEERFPDAQMEHVALKLCEEAGEVARAVNGVAGRNSATGGGDVGDEVADVFIAALVLLARWFPEADIATRISIKLHRLETPGEHRASLAGDSVTTKEGEG